LRKLEDLLSKRVQQLIKESKNSEKIKVIIQAKDERIK
jgi:hypothetical protein